MTIAHDRTESSGDTPLVDPSRIGSAPISWGVCEVPGWGVMLPIDRVFSEMRSLGITATELGAAGFLPDEPHALLEVLDRHGMSLIGGFVPLVLHDPARRADALTAARRTAELFAAADADVFVTAVVTDEQWSPRFVLSDEQWHHMSGMLDAIDELCAEYDLTQALHPHVGTLVQTAADVHEVLARNDTVRWCLDTGHLAIGGYDPADFARDVGTRVAHVHVKDADAELSAAVGRDELTVQQGVGRGLFRPLGAGDAHIAETVRELERQGYAGWYVIEQDEDLGPVAPEAGDGPLESTRQSIEFLRSLR